MDKYVIGQDKLKQTLSVALYNHYIKTNDLSDDRIDLQDESNFFFWFFLF